MTISFPKSASLVLAIFALASAQLTARAEVSVDVFYDSLSPYGDWVEVADYGYCWSPREVGSDWRPYTEGEWVYTDAGWTWFSDEPYGWAVYHYGRWLLTESDGWLWVPGDEWGPAWVSWRRSPEYVGWAPLPPEVRFSAAVHVSRNVDREFDIGPGAYIFVEVRNFGAERLRPVIVEQRRNFTIITSTTNITNITYVNDTVVNQGLEYDEILQVSERPVRKLKLNRRSDFSEEQNRIEGRAQIQGESLSIPAPHIVGVPKSKPQKVAKKIEKIQLRRGWNGGGSPEEVEKVRAKMKGEVEGESSKASVRDKDDKKPKAEDTELPESAAPKNERKPETEAKKKPDTHKKRPSVERSEPKPDSGDDAEKSKRGKKGDQPGNGGSEKAKKGEAESSPASEDDSRVKGNEPKGKSNGKKNAESERATEAPQPKERKSDSKKSEASGAEEPEAKIPKKGKKDEKPDKKREVPAPDRPADVKEKTKTRDKQMDRKSDVEPAKAAPPENKQKTVKPDKPSKSNDSKKEKSVPESAAVPSDPTAPQDNGKKGKKSKKGND